MKRKFFLKILGKIFLLMIIPLLLIIKLGWDSLLPIIIYLEFLLIWAQTEIGMRQTVMTSAQFEPSFYIEEITIPPTAKNSAVYCTYIHNVTENPAYTLGVGRILNRNNQPIYPAGWPKSLKANYISCLPPHQKLELYSINSEDREIIYNDELTFEVIYLNRFGILRTLRIKYLRGSPPLLIHEEVEKPGIFLNMIEDILFLSRLHKIKKEYIEKIKKAQETT